MLLRYTVSLSFSWLPLQIHQQHRTSIEYRTVTVLALSRSHGPYLRKYTRFSAVKCCRNRTHAQRKNAFLVSLCSHTHTHMYLLTCHKYQRNNKVYLIHKLVLFLGLWTYTYLSRYSLPTIHRYLSVHPLVTKQLHLPFHTTLPWPAHSIIQLPASSGPRTSAR